MNAKIGKFPGLALLLAAGLLAALFAMGVFAPAGVQGADRPAAGMTGADLNPAYLGPCNAIGERIGRQAPPAVGYPCITVNPAGMYQTNVEVTIEVIWDLGVGVDMLYTDRIGLALDGFGVPGNTIDRDDADGDGDATTGTLEGIDLSLVSVMLQTGNAAPREFGIYEGDRHGWTGFDATILSLYPESNHVEILNGDTMVITLDRGLGINVSDRARHQIQFSSTGGSYYGVLDTRNYPGVSSPSLSVTPEEYYTPVALNVGFTSVVGLDDQDETIVKTRDIILTLGDEFMPGTGEYTKNGGDEFPDPSTVVDVMSDGAIANLGVDKVKWGRADLGRGNRLTITLTDPQPNNVNFSRNVIVRPGDVLDIRLREALGIRTKAPGGATAHTVNIATAGGMAVASANVPFPPSEVENFSAEVSTDIGGETPQFTFSFMTAHPLMSGDEVTLFFDGQFTGHGPSLSKEHVIITASHPVNATTDLMNPVMMTGDQNPSLSPPRMREGSGMAYSIRVPDMNGPAAGTPGIGVSSMVTIIVSPEAGIMNPTEQGTLELGLKTDKQPRMASVMVDIQGELPEELPPVHEPSMTITPMDYDSEVMLEVMFTTGEDLGANTAIILGLDPKFMIDRDVRGGTVQVNGTAAPYSWHPSQNELIITLINPIMSNSMVNINIAMNVGVMTGPAPSMGSETYDTSITTEAGSADSVGMPPELPTIMDLVNPALNVTPMAYDSPVEVEVMFTTGEALPDAQMIMLSLGDNFMPGTGTSTADIEVRTGTVALTVDSISWGTGAMANDLTIMLADRNTRQVGSPTVMANGRVTITLETGLGIMTGASPGIGFADTYNVSIDTSRGMGIASLTLPQVAAPVTEMVHGFTVKNFPEDPGAVARFEVKFVTGYDLVANQDIITVHFDKDFTGHSASGLPREDVTVSARHSVDATEGDDRDIMATGAENPSTDASYDQLSTAKHHLPHKDALNNVEYQILVPDMNGTDEGSPGIAAGSMVTVSISTGAGITNPTEGSLRTGFQSGGKGPIGVFTSRQMEMAYDTVTVSRGIGLSSYASNRNKTLSVLGKGFQNGTDATVYLYKGNLNITDVDTWVGILGNRNQLSQVVDDSEVVINEVRVQSDDTFLATFQVTVPPFVAGTGNIIWARDANQPPNYSNAVPFEVEGLLTISPASAAVGDKIIINLYDWPVDGFIPDDAVTIAGVTQTISSGSQGVNSGRATFQIEINNETPAGTNEIRVDALGENDTVTITIAGADLSGDLETVVPNQVLTLTGHGFSGRETINARGDDSEIKVGNSAQHLESGTRNFNRGQPVTVSSGGTWSASLVVPMTSSTTAAGTYTVEVTDSGNRSGSFEITIPERTLSIEPTEARPGERVTLTGSGFPSDNSRTKEQSTPSVSIIYEDEDVGTARPDSSGNIVLNFVVPRNAGIPSSNRVEAVYQYISNGTSNRVVTHTNHEVPGARITLSAEEGVPGDLLTAVGDGFQSFTPIDHVLIGGINVTPAPKPATDRQGNLAATILVPDLAPGAHSVEISVGEGGDSEATANANFQILDDTVMEEEPMMVMVESEAATPEDAFAEVIADDNLIRVWQFDSSQQTQAPHYGWFLYDVRELFMAANTLDMIEPGGFYYFLVDHDQMDVTMGIHTVDLYAGWNYIIW